MKCHSYLTSLCPVSIFFFKFIFISWGGMRLSALSMSATNWPVVPVLDGKMSVEHLVQLARETEILGGNLHYCHFG
jgi:hypothetical protein